VLIWLLKSSEVSEGHLSKLTFRTTSKITFWSIQNFEVFWPGAYPKIVSYSASAEKNTTPRVCSLARFVNRNSFICFEKNATTYSHR
jgi:hypothetical protein